MVKSGLDPEIVEYQGTARVSQYRLAAHYTTALLIQLLSLGAGLRIVGVLSKSAPIDLSKAIKSLRGSVHGVATLAFLTAVSGAFVAGLDAGMIYDEFPLMGGRIIPSDWRDAQLSWWRNWTENPSAVQFAHRSLAIGTILATTLLFFKSRRIPQLPVSVSRAMNLTTAAAWSQGALGVSTLLMHVPIPLASAHQAGSIILMSCFVHLIRQLKTS